jgi:hypothetical protein
MPLAAAGCGHLRASDADRERAIEVLKVAFAQGRLAQDDFEPRIGQAFAARTYAELADVTAELIGAQPRQPAGARARKAAAWGAFGIILPALLAVAVVPGPITIRAAITTAVVIYLFSWACGASMMLASRLPKHSRRRLPPGAAASAD